MGIDADFFARTQDALTTDAVRDMAYRLANAVGPEHFFFDRKGESEWHPGGHALAIVPKYDQDGPTIYPEPGETFVRCFVFMRYYGPDYERGSWPVLRSIGDWMEANVGATFYGGDSSGVCAKPWAEIVQPYTAHWLRNGRLPYQRYFDNEPPLRTCALCRKPMIRNGWGHHGQFACVYCPGCGFAEETNDAGKTWVERGHES